MSVPKRWLHGEWTGPFGFVLALAGASIGLANLWSFPSLAARHGGGTFLLLYGAFLAALVLPLWLVEIGVGRTIRRSLPDGLRRIARDQGGARSWSAVGWLAVGLAGVVLVVQTVAGGWVGAWLHAVVTEPELEFDAVTTSALFAAVWAEAERFLLWHTLLVAAVCLVVGRGVAAGIQPLMRCMVPGLLLVLVALVFWAASIGDLAGAWQRLFAVRLESLTWQDVHAAAEYAVFSTATGLGVAAAFGAALPDRYPILSTAGAALALQIVAAVAGALFVFTALLPEGGEGGVPGGAVLLFHSLPQAIAGLQGGRIALLALFAMLLMAVATTAVAFLEVVVSAVVEQGRVRRAGATALVGGVVWLAGLFLAGALGWWLHADAIAPGHAALALSAVVSVTEVAFWGLIPVIGLLLLVFGGWCMPPETLRGALRLREDWRFDLWVPVLRYVAPLILAVLLARVAGLLPP